MVSPAVGKPCKPPALLPAQLGWRRSSKVLHRVHLLWVNEVTLNSAYAQGETPASPHDLMNPVPGLSPHPWSQQPHVHPLHSPGRAQCGSAGGRSPALAGLNRAVGRRM